MLQRFKIWFAPHTRKCAGPAGFILNYVCLPIFFLLVRSGVLFRVRGWYQMRHIDTF